MKIKTNVRAGQGSANSGLDNTPTSPSNKPATAGGVGGGGGGGGQVVYYPPVSRCAGI
jgi:hypothetical protein